MFTLLTKTHHQNLSRAGHANVNRRSARGLGVPARRIEKASAASDPHVGSVDRVIAASICEAMVKRKGPADRCDKRTMVSDLRAVNYSMIYSLARLVEASAITMIFHKNASENSMLHGSTQNIQEA